MATISAATAAPVISSPTMATPRPIPANLASLPANLTSLSLISETLVTRSEVPVRMTEESSRPVVVERALQGATGSSVNGSKSATESEGDGRITPLASESGAFSRSDSSSQSDFRDSSPRTAVSSTSNPSLISQKTSGTSLSSHHAEVGLCSLQYERQLREAAFGKDRMFLLLLAREIESFIGKVAQDEHPTANIPQGTTSSSVLAAMGASMMIQSSFTSSKYQRMLAYKAAEWYGLKGVAGPDGSIIIGLIGIMNPKSPSLRLSEIAPKPPSPKQSFKIMQRNANSDGTNTRASSTFGDEARRKTLEEREAEYALARQRIYGDVPGPAPSEVPTNGGMEPPIHGEEEFDPVPRYPNAVIPNPYMPPEPIYASLIHPPKIDTSLSPLPQPSQAYPSPEQSYVFQTPTVPSDYTQPSMHPYQTRMPHNGHVPSPQGMMPFSPQYAQNPNGYGNPGPGNYPGYGWPQPTQGPYGHMPMRAVSEPPQHMQGQMPMPQMGINNGWYGHMPYNSGQPMPMIPQGVQYMGQYGPPQQHMYPPLDQPTPMRPHIVPHQQGSAGSSMSSRSYQDISRPHSRGSTTSTRSATSSVRMGFMYPAGPGSVSGYRQQGYKAPMFGGMSTLGASDRRQPRAHSPSSATTISSRSSRVASIVLQPPAPGQHQLPQRPDWAANNVPYHPSPMPNGPKSGPNTFDFPPLHRNGMIAEPMQVERAKRSFPSRSASVWSGSNGKAPESPLSPSASLSNGMNGDYTVHEAPTSITPHPAPAPIAAVTPAQVEAEVEVPRRAPSSPNPSGDNTTDRSSQLSSLSSAGPRQMEGEDSMSAQDLIEAKLAALSVSQGIAIGPPPLRALPASYAKVVRRE